MIVEHTLQRWVAIDSVPEGRFVCCSMLRLTWSIPEMTGMYRCKAVWCFDQNCSPWPWTELAAPNDWSWSYRATTAFCPHNRHICSAQTLAESLSFCRQLVKHSGCKLLPTAPFSHAQEPRLDSMHTDCTSRSAICLVGNGYAHSHRKSVLRW